MAEKSVNQNMGTNHAAGEFDITMDNVRQAGVQFVSQSKTIQTSLNSVKNTLNDLSSTGTLKGDSITKMLASFTDIYSDITKYIQKIENIGESIQTSVSNKAEIDEAAQKAAVYGK